MKQGKMKDKNNKNQTKKGFYKHQELNTQTCKANFGTRETQSY